MRVFSGPLNNLATADVARGPAPALPQFKLSRDNKDITIRLIGLETMGNIAAKIKQVREAHRQTLPFLWRLAVDFVFFLFLFLYVG